MKINQIVGEHKKGFRAKKYAKKPVNAIGPKKPAKKPEPITAQGPVGPGDQKVDETAKITKSDQSGVEITADDGVKTTLPPEKASAISPDPDNPNEYDLNLSAVQQTKADPSSGPKVGSNVEIKTAEDQSGVQVPEIPAMPDISGLQPGVRQDLGSGLFLTLNNNGTVEYVGGFGTFVYDKSGKALSYTSPVFNGYGHTVDLTTGAKTQNYNAGPLSVQKTTDAAGKQTSSDTSYNLGPATVRQQRDATGVKNTAYVPDGDTTHVVQESPELEAMLRIAGLR